MTSNCKQFDKLKNTTNVVAMIKQLTKSYTPNIIPLYTQYMSFNNARAKQ